MNENEGSPPDRRATAHHEAGHAAAMLVLGYDVEYTTVASTADSWGRTKPMSDKSDVYKRLVYVRAGEAAEARFTQNALETRKKTLSVDGDEQIVDELLDLHEATGSSIGRIQIDADASRHAYWIVNEYAPALIDALADALFEEETLNNSRVGQIFNSFRDGGDGLRLVPI